MTKPAAMLPRLADDAGCASCVEAALRFLVCFPGVTRALAGITFPEQAAPDADAVAKGPLAGEAYDLLHARVREVYKNVQHLRTACGYGGECPAGIRIPKVLAAHTSLLVSSLAAWEAERIRGLMAVDGGAYDPALCEACRECEAKCPNSLPTAALMEDAAARWPA